MYRTRVVDAAVADVLTYSGGLLIEGVRACGKTETGRRHARSEVALDSGAPAVEAILAADPGLLLRGEVPRLLDEWQLEPSLWNRVRREIDVRQAKALSAAFSSIRAVTRDQSTPCSDMPHPG